MKQTFFSIKDRADKNLKGFWFDLSKIKSPYFQLFSINIYFIEFKKYKGSKYNLNTYLKNKINLFYLFFIFSGLKIKILFNFNFNELLYIYIFIYLFIYLFIK